MAQTLTVARVEQSAHLVPIHRTALFNDVLRANFGVVTDEDRKLVVATDADVNELYQLWMLQNAITGEVLALEGEAAKTYGGERLDLAEDVAGAAVEIPELEAKLVRLHELALRRLVNTPPEGEHLKVQWLKEEEQLFKIIERIREYRYEERKRVLKQSG